MQTHFFATKGDLVPRLTTIETDLGVRYASCVTYSNRTCEQYSSLLDWAGLGHNPTGDRARGAQFLVVPKSQPINIENHQR
jgi:hypothetical protein